MYNVKTSKINRKRVLELRDTTLKSLGERIFLKHTYVIVSHVALSVFCESIIYKVYETVGRRVHKEFIYNIVIIIINQHWKRGASNAARRAARGEKPSSIWGTAKKTITFDLQKQNVIREIVVVRPGTLFHSTKLERFGDVKPEKFDFL